MISNTRPTKTLSATSRNPKRGLTWAWGFQIISRSPAMRVHVLAQQQPGAGAAQAFRYHATGSQIRGKRLRSSNMTVSSALSMSLPSGRIALQGPGLLPGVGAKPAMAGAAAAAPWRDWISRARDQTDGENKRVLAVETGTLTRHFLRFGRWGTPLCKPRCDPTSRSEDLATCYRCGHDPCSLDDLR